MTDNVDKIWESYFNDRSNRNLLVLLNNYAPVIEAVAKDILDDSSDLYDNVLTAGVFSLREIIEEYNSDLTGFEDYCKPLIRQAMLEELEYA